jgi:cytochrome c oxidase subunit 4
MEATHKEHPKYFRIFWWLLALTIVEVGLAIPEYSQVLKAILLIGLATTKAAFVALYFMHLKFEKRTLTVIALIPLIICVFLVLMMLPDLMAESRHPETTASASHTVETFH